MLIFNSHKTIEILIQFLPDNPIIVEAGAYNGRDTLKMMQQWPEATIHAFEPLLEIYQRLVATTQNYKNIQTYPFALSEKNGQSLFFVSEHPDRKGMASQAGSLYKPKERLERSPLIFPRTDLVTTITLDTWAQENNINHIDLLWLDTQGHELAILRAAPNMLNHISVILAEVSFIESYEGMPLYEEVVLWMKDHGFDHVGRDFADTTKSFFGNALFIKK